MYLLFYNLIFLKFIIISWTPLYVNKQFYIIILCVVSLCKLFFTIYLMLGACICGGQRTACRNPFSSAAVLVLGWLFFRRLTFVFCVYIIASVYYTFIYLTLS